MEKKQNFYLVYDKVLCSFSHGFSCASDSIAVRSVLSTLRVPIKDSILFCIGSFKADFNPEIVEIGFECVTYSMLDSWRVVPWSSYKFPESPAEALAPLGLSPDEVKDIANRKIADIGSNQHRPDIQKIVDSFVSKEI